MSVAGLAPYVELDGILDPERRGVPDVPLFTELDPSERIVKSFHIRVQRPKFPWGAFLFGLLVYIVPGLLVAGFWLAMRARGHTYLYVTTQRIVVVELAQGSFQRDQVVLSFALRDISGFVLHSQHGIRKLLGFLRLQDKRTFYLNIVTRSAASFVLGAVSTTNSAFEPAVDGPALCSELDRLVLGLTARQEG